MLLTLTCVNFFLSKFYEQKNHHSHWFVPPGFCRNLSSRCQTYYQRSRTNWMRSKFKFKFFFSWSLSIFLQMCVGKNWRVWGGGCRWRLCCPHHLTLHWLWHCVVLNRVAVNSSQCKSIYFWGATCGRSYGPMDGSRSGPGLDPLCCLCTWSSCISMMGIQLVRHQYDLIKAQ